MVPEGWATAELTKRSIGVIDGDRGKNYPGEGEINDNGYCLFLSAKNVAAGGFAFSQRQFISEETHRAMRKGILERGDLVLTTRGTVGNVAIYDESVPFDVVRINSGMVIVRNRDKDVSTEFLYLLFRSFVIQDQVKRLTFGSAQPQLTVGIINRFDIPLPPLPEQQKIAEILGTWDKAIETTEALLANARTHKRALMQALLKGELGLDGHHKPFNYSFGSLGSGIKLISGQHIDAEMVNELGDGTPYLTGPADFSDGEIRVTKFTTSPKVRCDRGDILITVKGSGTGKTIVADQSYCISRQLMAIRPVSFEPRWIRYVIEMDQENYRSAAAGLIPGIGRAEILDKIVPVPSYDDQAQIAELIHTSEEIEKRELRSLQALRTEKKSLMQQLLTGKRRVVV